MIMMFMVTILLLIVYSNILESTSINKFTRVAIVGSGPGGLGLAACFNKIDCGVKFVDIYESRSSILQPSLGGGLQLSGGAAVIDKIGCYNELKSIALPFKQVLARTNNNFKLIEMNLVDAINNWPINELKSSGESSQPVMCSIMRDALQSLLYNISTTNTHSKLNLYVNKVVSSVEEYDDGKVRLLFNDGTVADGYDAVFGADGIRSTVKDYVTGKIDEYNSNPTGIRISFVISPPDTNKSLRPIEQFNRFNQWFGDGCYVLEASYGGLNGVQHMLAVVYKEDSDIKDKGLNWISTDLSSYDNSANITDVIFNNLKQGNLANNENIIRILKSADTSRIIDLGIRDRYFPLINWSSKSGRVILSGDSAHPMAPFLGQGANQALIDAYVLTQCIKKLNDNSNNYNIRDLINEYESKRKFECFQISLKANILGVIETFSGPVGQIIRNSIFFILGITGLGIKAFLSLATPKF